MTDMIMELCRAMGAGEDQRALLRPLVQASQQLLRERLRPGTQPADCGTAFPLAAAMLAMEGLEQAEGGSQVESFTAGEVTIRRGKGGIPLSQQAERLMAPWLREHKFAFRGVTG